MKLLLCALPVVPKICKYLPMSRIVFIVYPGFELPDMSGPVSVFSGANRALATRGKLRCYSIELASAEGGTIMSSGGVAVQTRPLEDLNAGAASEVHDETGAAIIDTVLVMGAEREPLLEAMRHAGLREAIPTLVKKSRRVGSVCTGAFILAAHGLLQGHRIATHWDGCAPLAAAFPGLNVDAEALYVEDGRYWTFAGVSTGIDMALAMVARDLDHARNLAQAVSGYARRALDPAECEHIHSSARCAPGAAPRPVLQSRRGWTTHPDDRPGALRARPCCACRRRVRHRAPPAR